MNEHESARGYGQRTVRLDVAYRGTGFRGFAANEGVRTVAGELGAALERILGETPVLTVAGRTDAGVHATGQVVSFRIGGEGLRRLGGSHDQHLRAARALAASTADGSGQGDDSPVELPRLASSLNRLLNPDIAVTAASFADDSFDARHSATGRAYEYRVRNATHPDPRSADLEWHVAAPLDIDQMNAAAGHFVGEHDFTSFCRRPKDRPQASLVRTVSRARWSAESAQMQFEIEANAFCHQMVRAIVGQCVAVGRGDRSAGDVPAVLAARSRDAAAPIAPPHGLTLVAVRYPDDAR
ncbi:tRNA pseudouridine(38-40) synthase TruA [Candidatus Poriferisodalis sp.]|uniref:tRNA pseudouridine(38-40) synthase TruA n=1 Tax=Candidatus Poriferisodalis sp. TaxID=3101277 RepID=UPI003B0149CD